MPTIPVGQFIEGMDTLHAEDDRVFQPGRTEAGFTPPKRCVAAINVDLDDEGRPEWRAGIVSRAAATGGLSAFSALGLLLFQDQGVIKKLDPDNSFAEVSLVTGLDTSARVIFHEHAGAIYWTNGIENGQITAAGTATNWGLAIAPSPTLGTTTGTVPAGRYMVAASFVDANGVEHAASKSSVVVLASAGAITAALTPIDANAVTVRFYATEPNGDQLFYVGSAAVGSLPVTINSVVASYEPLRTQHFSAPIPGDGLFSYHGMLLTFKDGYLYPSYGPAVHLYDTSGAEEGRPTNILAGAGLPTGFWTVCEHGAFWTTGDEPKSFETNQIDNREYAAGTLVLPGSLVPKTQTFKPVALFVSEDGLMAGLPDGSLMPLSDDKHRLDVTGKRVSIVYYPHSNFDQILFNLMG